MRFFKAVGRNLRAIRDGLFQLLFLALPGGLAAVIVAGAELWIRVGTWLGVGGLYGPADGMTVDEMGGLWRAGLGVVHVAIAWALYDRIYLRTPPDRFEGIKPGPFAAVFIFSFLFIGAGFVVTLPVAATLAMASGLCATAWWSRFPAAGVALAGVPGLIAGYSMVRRAVWLWRVRGQIENTPTARVRSAALGLVELKGVARAGPREGPADRPILLRKGVAYITEPFDLEDETGRVRVEPPRERARGADARIALVRRADARTPWGDAELRPGDPIYVLGNLEVAAGPDAATAAPGAPGGTGEAGPERPRHVVRPLVPPYGRFLDTDAAGDSPVGWFLGAFAGIGFGHLPDLFLLTDADEADVKRRFFRQGRRTLAWGMIWCACSAPLLYWGVRGLIAPGSACLLRAVGGG